MAAYAYQLTLSLVALNLHGFTSALVIPEGAGPVKTTAAFAFAMFWSFLVLAGRVEVGVGVKARAQPDRVAAVGP